MATGVKAGMAALALLLAAAVSHSASVLLSDLKEQTHIHGLAVNPANPDQILVATHHGLYRAGLDGQAELISPVQDFMGFTRDPGSRDTLFASGHPAGGGNLGFIASSDGGSISGGRSKPSAAIRPRPPPSRFERSSPFSAPTWRVRLAGRPGRPARDRDA